MYFRPLNCISVNIICKIDCILCKLSYVRSASKQARTRSAKHKYDIKNSGIKQCGLTDHLHKGVHYNQLFQQKLGNLRMVLIDQVVDEIIVNNVCVLCELKKPKLIDYKHIKSLINTMIIFLIGAVLTNPKQNDSWHYT